MAGFQNLVKGKDKGQPKKVLDFHDSLRSSITIKLNIAKGTTDPRVEFISQVLIKLQFQNLD